jgi:predicted amidohydrolase YtcJ
MPFFPAFEKAGLWCPFFGSLFGESRLWAQHTPADLKESENSKVTDQQRIGTAFPGREPNTVHKAFIIVILLILIFSCSCTNQTESLPPVGLVSQPPDLVLYNGNIFTSNKSQLLVQAMAVRDGRFLYVGSSEEALALADNQTQLIDLNERFVTPGFIDTHAHVLWVAALTPMMAIFTDAEQVSDVLDSVTAFADANTELPFVLGVGWRHIYFPDQRPTKEMLDAAIDDRPVFLFSIGGDSGWVNSKALEVMRATNPRAYEQLGPILDEHGEPTGLFDSFFAFNPFDFFFDGNIPESIEAVMYPAMEAILAEAISVGVTTVEDAQTPVQFLPTVLKFADRGGFENIRARALLYVGHAEALDATLVKKLDDWKALATTAGSDHLFLGDGIKLYADGVPDGKTGAFFEPYSNDPTTTGTLYWSQSDFDRVTQLVHERGLQACTHATGDRGTDLIINSYGRLSQDPASFISHRIEHCEFLTPGNFGRMATFGITAAMHPTHFLSSDSVLDAVGPARLQKYLPWRSLERAGVRISFGSDWLNTPINPIVALVVSALRPDQQGGSSIGPEEAISIEDAIIHYTLGSAQAARKGDQLGSIEPGKLADFVVFDVNVLDLEQFVVDVEQFANNADAHPLSGAENQALDFLNQLVLQTYVDGRVVYERP